MSEEFIRFIGIDGEPMYIRKCAIKAVCVHGESSTVIDLFDGECFYVKGEVDRIAQSFLNYQGRGIYS